MKFFVLIFTLTLVSGTLKPKHFLKFMPRADKSMKWSNQYLDDINIKWSKIGTLGKNTGVKSSCQREVSFKALNEYGMFSNDHYPQRTREMVDCLYKVDTLVPNTVIKLECRRATLKMGDCK